MPSTCRSSRVLLYTLTYLARARLTPSHKPAAKNAQRWPTRSQATWRAPQPAERRCPPLCTLALPVCAHTGTTHIRQNAVIAGSYWGKGRAQNDARIVQIRCAEHVVDTRLSRMLLSHNLLRGALATRTYVSTLGAGRRRRYLAAPKGGGSHWPSLRFILSL